MSYGLTVGRGGPYTRLAEPSWIDPLDTSYSKQRGGRWNPPGSYGVLYLNATEELARLQVRHKLAGQPYGVEDLDPSEQHDLVDVEVSETDVLDCVSADGLAAVGLPRSYPVATDGQPVSHEECWPVAARARADDLTGIACRSAATGAAVTDEELALFEPHAARLVRQIARRTFGDWYLAQA